MSFLYKALLKEQASGQAPKQQAKQPDKQDAPLNSDSSSQSWSGNGQNGNTQNNNWSAESSQQSSWNQHSGAQANAWANQSQGWHHAKSENGSSWHWGAWTLIAILLLVVGVMSGYLLGVQPWTVKQSSQLNQSTIASEANQVNEGSQEVSAQSDLTEASPVSVQNTTQLHEQDSGQAELLAAEEEPIDRTFEFANGKIKEAPIEAPTENGSVKEPSAKASAINEASVVPERQALTIDDYAPSNVDIEDVPEELKAAFELAVAELEQEQAQDIPTTNDRIKVETDSTLTDINELTDQEQAQIPQLLYQMHIFASDPSSRWIKVNDKTLYEGDYLNNNLKLVEIRQDVIIWETAYRRFSQNALQDYL